MTSEVVIMNNEAIALAADSAVTLTGEHGQEKIFTSMNKIFALSKHHPVGIMIYGNANFMGVPWETLIKLYRQNLGPQKFDTLDEYASNFIEFLRNNTAFFPEAKQEEYVQTWVFDFFTALKVTIIEETNLTPEDEIEDVAAAIIKNKYDLWKKAKRLPSMRKSNIVQKLKTRYLPLIEPIITKSFEDEEFPIEITEYSTQLTELALNLIMKMPEDVDPPPHVSGVIIAGFGEKELFPSFKAFFIEAIVNDLLKYKEGSSVKIDFENTASLYPFAQKDMVHMFMGGIDLNFLGFFEKEWSDMFEELPELIVDEIEEIHERLTKKEKRVIKEQLTTTLAGLKEEQIERLIQYRRKNYIDPVIDVIKMLPKAELAKMAETLVNLTSFRLRMTWEPETVGGPVNVAVISKGDGFVWIKHQNYFPAELNPPGVDL